MRGGQVMLEKPTFSNHGLRNAVWAFKSVRPADPKIFACDWNSLYTKA